MPIVFDKSQTGKVIFDEQPKQVVSKSKVVFDNPSIGGVSKQFAIGFGNQFAMGFPLAALKKYKGEETVKELESGNPIERVARGVGTTIGMFTPAPQKIFQLGALAGKALTATKVAKAGEEALRAGMSIEKATKIANFTKKGIETGAGVGAFELFSAPENGFKEKIVTVPTATLFGAGLGVGGEAISPFIKKFLVNKGLLKGDYVSGTKTLDDLNKVLTSKTQPKETTKLITTKINANSTDPYIPSKMASQVGSLKTKIYDQYAPVQHLKEVVQEVTGKNLDFKLDPYEAAKNYLGVGGKALDNIYKFRDIISQNKRYIPQMEQIFRAESFLERANKGIKNPEGFDSIKSQEALNHLRTSLGDGLFNELSATTNNIRRNLLDNIIKESEGTFFSSDDVKKILSENQSYAPTQVLKYLSENENRLPNGFRSSEPSNFKKAVGTESDIDGGFDSVIDYLMRTTRAIEGSKVKQKIVDVRNLSSELEKVILKAGENEIPKGFDTVSVFRNGVKEQYHVPQMLADTMNGMDKETADFMTKIASFTGRALRAGSTSLSIPFSIANIPRDILQAMTTSKVGFNPITDWTRGFAEAIKKGDVYRQWLSSGGSFSNVQSLYGNIPSKTAELVPTLSKKISENTNPIKWLNKVAEISEQSTRLGTFTRALRMGYPLEQAGNISRDATVDFAKMGTKMQIANQWIPFLNARTQGTVNIFKSMRDNPKQVALVGSGIIGLPTLTTYLWNTKEYPDVWDNISQNEKNSNILFIYGREQDEQGRYLQVAKIPKGDVGRILGSPIEMFMDYWRGQSKQTWPQMATQLLSDISPIGFADKGRFEGRLVASSLLPPIAKAPLENITNVNLFSGRNIVPESLSKASPREQYDIKTSSLAIAVGDILNVSPMKIENMVGTLTGSAGRQVMSPSKIPNLIGSRFSGAYGNEEQNLQFDILNDIVQDSGDIKAKNLRLARQAIVDFDNIQPSPEVRKEYIRNKFGDNKEALNKFMDLLVSKSTNEKPIDRALKGVSIQDRLKFIRQYSETLNTPEEKILFLRNLMQNNVITPSSIERKK